MKRGIGSILLIVVLLLFCTANAESFSKILENAYIALYQGDYQSALIYFYGANEMNPESEEVITGIAKVYSEMEKAGKLSPKNDEKIDMSSTNSKKKLLSRSSLLKSIYTEQDNVDSEKPIFDEETFVVSQRTATSE